VKRRTSIGINSETRSFGIGPVVLDVEMARAQGWSEKIIQQAAFAIGAISREANYQAALSKGHTHRCPVCECWTVSPPAPCHQCEADPR
jgi:hypothetical protein